MESLSDREKIKMLEKENDQLRSDLNKAQKEISVLERQKYKGLYGADS